MFVLCCMKDTIRIKPHLFRLDIHYVIEEQLNKKFANKVVHNVGLCIGVYDILSISDSYVLPGDGSSFTSGYPAEDRSDYEEQLWLWEYQTENRIHDLFMDVNKEVRFRVVDHIFADSAPVSDTAQKEDNENESYDCSKSPYTIIGTINHPGLGLVTWWNN
ncbi:uncharacterized protein TRIADDRAFT_53108 [Trichoplax adhaerens]|uniref:RNA polymerase III subunit Rpc25 domain-containing protein n=1 Tax=Trichoplax adhaerens TaxID=10228 RepID=B3RNB8_TRIAD|nr:hypothetical protein TRIADDRAFT_53108 [Trichoplax adhaerens]EDV27426.1 hypothetical protein TRIADDRAFT_53108 [Trichoplax adhaerens]|eukprot:XP_002109260.1 hypothetical protein TRIADDRAFT_53108 [Trichoplax adhaerens]